jgi:GTP-binding protein
MSDKKINFNSAKLTISAGFLKQVPKDMPHIVFSGRSNVGKSTLINKIVNQNKLARTSSSPGKTITINFFETDRSFYIVDLPGYGYAKRSDSEIKKWSDLVEGYFKQNAGNNISLIVQLVDLKVGATKDDMTMINYMNNAEIPYIIVATKADKLNKTQREACINKLNELKNTNQNCVIIPFSSLSGEGIDDVRRSIAGYVK